MGESNTRSIVKTVSWRITGSSLTFLIAYLILGDLSVSGFIAFIQFTVNTILYYVHERLWNKIQWGKVKTL